MNLLVAVMVVIWFGTGCSREVTVEGYYATALEYSALIPCGEERGMWLEGNEGFHERYVALVGHPQKPMDSPGRVYVRVKGIRKGPGKFGHLDAWEYEFLVEEVLEMRLPSESDCRD